MTSWEERGAAKQQTILDALRPEWRLPIETPSPESQRNVTGDYLHQFLSQQEIEITESLVEQLLSNIADQKWSTEAVVEAFCHTASLAHQLTNCLHEVIFEDALKDARRLDAHLEKHGSVVGPLHGLPISLKDSVNVKGYDTTTGVVGLIGKPATEDAEIVKILRNLGAIIYCKTSTAQVSFAAETDNHIVGYTLNAHNRLLSSGGSTGGEGPLIAMRGSVLGLGTDIGGSIRHPAALNGAFGLKPSYRRLPFEGIPRVMEGQDFVPFSLGPLSSSAAGLSLLMRAVLSKEPWLTDPRVVPLPWKEDVFEDFREAMKGGRQLLFGVMRDDGVVRPQPPIARGLELLVEKVHQLGHKSVEWKPPSHEEATKLVLDTWAFDGSDNVFKHLELSGEPIVPSVADAFGDKRREPYTAQQIADTNIAIWRYRKRYMDYWNGTKEEAGIGRPVDAVLMPTYPYAGVIQGKLKYAGYTPYGNVLDYSVGVIPVTTADAKVDVYREDGYVALGEMDAQVKDSYDAEKQHGAPVGISIFGRRFEDEKVLGILEGLSAALAK